MCLGHLPGCPTRVSSLRVTFLLGAHVLAGLQGRLGFKASLYHSQLCDAKELIVSLFEQQSAGCKVSVAIGGPVLPGDS